ncbi:MAG: heavy metal translocating P-type ATPase [Bacillota bacterium]|jgi:Cd2+/Zn2+-exporting ATPase
MNYTRSHTHSSASAVVTEVLSRISRNREILTVAVSGALIVLAWSLRALGLEADTRGGFRLLSSFNVLMTAAAIVAGIPVAREAVGRLSAKQFSIPLLVTIATVGALWIGETWEGAAVTFLYVLGGYLESLTLSRTRAALRSLIDLSPKTARVKRDSGVDIVAAAEVQAGETVVVLPGDRVPVDGVVLDGRASLDTSPLTGEPLPAEVGIGDRVMGGSVSQSGFLEVRAERVGPDTTFSRIVFLVAEAQEQRPKVQKMLDRFASWYTPLIIALAGALYVTTRDVHFALTFLVIGCPGALVVAAPVAVVAGLGSAAKKGILIKGGERLERIGKVDVMAFDKTGTLTLGKPKVTAVEVFSDLGSEALHEDSDSSNISAALEHRLISLAAGAELRSEHHLAKAILDYAGEKGIDPASVRNWSLLPGLGAVAESEEGIVLVGNRRLLQSNGVELSEHHEKVASAHEAQGRTLAFVAAGGSAIGLMAIADPPRPGADRLVGDLKKAGVLKTVMLTGDNESAARHVAAGLGVDEVRAGLLPEEKVAAIREMQKAGHIVAMVGDGVNDAPALAVADVSIAMGASGTEAAIETADIALMADRLDRVPEAIDLSRRILKVVRQNVAFAVATVVLLLVGVIGRVVFLSGGMLIHEASVLLVILSGMRLLRGREKQHTTPPS